MPLPTTSKYSFKQYRCTHCEMTQMIGTNHYGEVYSRCVNTQCISRRPVINKTHKPPRHVCMEALPEGMSIPTPWEFFTLGDIAEVVG